MQQPTEVDQVMNLGTASPTSTVRGSRRHQHAQRRGPVSQPRSAAPAAGGDRAGPGGARAHAVQLGRHALSLQALGYSACRAGHRVRFSKVAKLLQALLQSPADNSFERELRGWLAPDVVILDDFGLRKLTAQQSSDFYDVLVERDKHAATVITSNRAVDEWVALYRRPHPRQQRPRSLRPSRPSDRHGGPQPARRPRPRRPQGRAAPNPKQPGRGIARYGSARQRGPTSLYGPRPPAAAASKWPSPRKGLARSAQDAVNRE